VGGKKWSLALGPFTVEDSLPRSYVNINVATQDYVLCLPSFHSLTLSRALPREHDHPVYVDLLSEVDHPYGVVNVVVVHDGAVRQVGVAVAVDGE
jgi:hypothetical protein